MAKKDIDNKKKITVEQLEAQLQEIASTIDLVEDEKLEITNSLKKALADYQNLERSITGRVESQMQFLKKDVAIGMIEILDDMKFAQEAKESLELSDEVRAWAEGMVSSMNKLSKALEKLGVLSIKVVAGDLFDSSIHEAVGVIAPAKDEVSGSIKEVVQTGYMMGELVVRPTRVVVIKK